jgi:light-regulated signal transduction histidine kinase (bacteriophytochrome)
MSVGQVLDAAVSALESISTETWKNAFTTAVRDLRSKASTEQEILDGLAMLFPQYAALIAAAEMVIAIYQAGGGHPATPEDLVWKRSDGNDMDRDV